MPCVCGMTIAILKRPRPRRTAQGSTIHIWVSSIILSALSNSYMHTKRTSYLVPGTGMHLLFYTHQDLYCFKVLRTRSYAGSQRKSSYIQQSTTSNEQRFASRASGAGQRNLFQSGAKAEKPSPPHFQRPPASMPAMVPTPTCCSTSPTSQPSGPTRSYCYCCSSGRSSQALTGPTLSCCCCCFRGDRRKRLEDPLGPAAVVADVTAGAAVAVAAAAAPWCHRSPFAPSPPHLSPHHLAPSTHALVYLM